MIRTSRSWRFAAAAVAAGLSLAACGTTNDNSNSSSSSGKDCSATIAFLGPTTGPYANLGINIIDGAKVAQQDFEKANSDCTFTVKQFDSQGDPDKAKNLAVQIVNDDDIIGVLGPTFSGESDSTGKSFNEAGLVTVSASATNPLLTTHGWTTFHRILGNDNTQGPPAADYIKNELSAKNVFVVDDSSEYGKGLGDIVKNKLGSLVTDSDEVQQGQTDFSATVTKVKAANADVLFYGGYYPEAGLFIKQLRAGGWNGQFVSGDGTKDPGFVEAAGAKAAAGSILTCPCVDSTGDFFSKYKQLNGQDPGTYSPEGYDAMNIFMQGVKDGNTDRQSMLDWVNNYDQDALTKHIAFTPEGEVTITPIYAFKVADNGDIEGIKQIN
jgi:branched-chain amino acid transport system substrate-binding protein